MEPAKIDLFGVMEDMIFERELVVAARKMDVCAMVLRFQAGACVACIANVLHYQPEVLPSVFAAIDRLQLDQRQFNTAVLWQMGLRLRGNQMPLIRAWYAAHEARNLVELSAAPSPHGHQTALGC